MSLWTFEAIFPTFQILQGISSSRPHTDNDLLTWDTRAPETLTDFGLILIVLRTVDMPENIGIAP